METTEKDKPAPVAMAELVALLSGERLILGETQRAAERGGGYSLDLDSTIFQRCGRQESSPEGHYLLNTDAPAVTCCWPYSRKPTSRLDQALCVPAPLERPPVPSLQNPRMDYLR